MREKFKTIRGYEKRYKISNFGRVYSLLTKRIMSLHTSKQTGYVDVCLTATPYSQKTYVIYRLVAEAFIPNPKNLPCINHKDTNRANNIVSNLEWCTHSYNTKYAYKMGTMDAKGENNGRSKLTNEQVDKIRSLLIKGKLLHREIARMFSVNRTLISMIQRGVRRGGKQIQRITHNARRKLSISDVKKIKLLLLQKDANMCEIGRKFHVHNDTIQAIKTGRTFTYVKI
jgi:hypothetical protein